MYEGVDGRPKTVLTYEPNILFELTYTAYSNSFTLEVTAPAKNEAVRRPAFAMMAFTLLSSNVVAYWRRVISSNLGCFHVPFGVCSCGVCGAGVCGVAGAAIERDI